MSLTAREIFDRECFKAGVQYDPSEWPPIMDDESVDDYYSRVEDLLPDDQCPDDLITDYQDEVRSSYDEETNLPCPVSNHYECISVAKRIGDHWIGWDYWYGGGKWGNPEDLDFRVYFLDVTEEEVTLTRRVFAEKND